MARFLLISVLTVFFCECFKADDDVKSEADLRRALFAHYDKLVRPVRSVSSVVDVQMDIELYGINEIDVDKKIVELDAGLSMEWDDEFLRWDPSEYGGLRALILPASEVWRPDMAIYYAYPIERLFPKIETRLYLSHNGSVHWLPPFTIRSRCLTVPDQLTEGGIFKCTLLAGSWEYDGRFVDVHSVLSDHHLENFHDTHVWTVQSLTTRKKNKKFSCCEEPQPLLYFDFVFKRRRTNSD